MPMRIAINARYTHRRSTGVERYARELSSRLSHISRQIKPVRPLAPVAGHLWEQLILPAKLRSNEVLWSPANTSAWTVRRQAVTIHDASPFDHPEWFKPSFAAWTRLSWRVLAKRAQAIITVSRFSRERLKFHLGIPDEKIHVIPNGVAKPFEPQPAKTVEEARKKYSLIRSYFLFVGTLEPRKNLQTLFQAWDIFENGSFGVQEQAPANSDGKLSDSKYQLVIAGTEGTVFAPLPGLRNPTCAIGYVPDSDLPALYSGASAVIVPSLYEGFGVTALEAMACGAPVIASNTASYPEVTGDAALLVNPSNSTEIANAIRQIIEDPALANGLRERGLQRAAQFTWEEPASKIQSLLESL